MLDILVWKLLLNNLLELGVHILDGYANLEINAACILRSKSSDEREAWEPASIKGNFPAQRMFPLCLCGYDTGDKWFTLEARHAYLSLPFQQNLVGAALKASKHLGPRKP